MGWRILFLVLLVSSCVKDEKKESALMGAIEETKAIQLDVVLENTMKAAIPAEQRDLGLSFYKLPDSDDFQNIPQDPKNPLSEDKVHLGKILFHETALATLSQNVALIKTYSCASCHNAPAGFGSPAIQGIAEGGLDSGFDRHPDTAIKNQATIDAVLIKSPSIANIAYQPNTLWNGLFGSTAKNIGTESVWNAADGSDLNKLGFEGTETQAIGGLGAHKLLGQKDNVQKARFNTSIVMQNNEYVDLFNKAFPLEGKPAKSNINVNNVGLAIAAYERTVLTNKAPYQRWLRGDKEAMTTAQKRGALVFFGKGKCYECHTGPGLTSNEFYALGVNSFRDRGGVFVNDESNNLHLGRASFTKKDSDRYKFKVPQLYNLKDQPAFGSGASFDTIRDVIIYKNSARAQNPEVPETQLATQFVPLNLNVQEVSDLEEFLKEGLYDPELDRYTPEKVISGQCFPNNDAVSKAACGG